MLGLVLAAAALFHLLSAAMPAGDLLVPVDCFLIMMPAVIAAGLLFGRGAAPAAALLGLPACLLLLSWFADASLAGNRADAIQTAIFVAVALLVAAGSDAFLVALERAGAANAALAATERRHRALAEAGATIVWRADPSGAIVESRGWDRLTGMPEASMDGWGWLDAVHPDDRDVTVATWAEARAGGHATEVEFRVRLREGGDWRWMRAKAVPIFPEGAQATGDKADPVEWMGVLEDVHERHQSEQQREILSREVDHRARNLLSVVQAVLRLTPRGDPAAHAEAVERRIAALGRAHALLAEARWMGADLTSLAQEELAAYGGLGSRLRLDGPAVALAPDAAQAFSMVLHELATNAAKYGSLLSPEGRVCLLWRIEGDGGEDCLHLRWEELGGPPVAGPPPRRGFGSRVIRATIVGQLGGRVEHQWHPAGLVCELWLPLRRTLARREDIATRPTA